ncbi:MAG: hypothetical protein MK033_12990 [Candidatus Caenarcaniphilales bacterium]|nr:hypothetical protein [Candidatus Caenarcaniphilales bacterium]
MSNIPSKATTIPVPKGIVKGLYLDKKPMLYFCPSEEACLQEEAFRLVFQEETNIDFQEINELGSNVFLRFIFPENISIRESSEIDYGDLFNLSVSHGFENTKNLNQFINQVEHNKYLNSKAFIDIKIPSVNKSIPEKILRKITLQVNKKALIISHNHSKEALIETQIISNNNTESPQDDLIISRNSFDIMTPDGEFSSDKLIQYTVVEIGDDINGYNYL